MFGVFGVYRVYIGIMEKKTENCRDYSGYVGVGSPFFIMEKKNRNYYSKTGYLLGL